MLFNPFTGTPRHPDDIKSDPHGLLVWDGETPLKAAAVAGEAVPRTYTYDEIIKYGRICFWCARATTGDLEPMPAVDLIDDSHALDALPAAPVDALRKALQAFLTWGESQCPCRDETPDPCPLCGASVAEGTCKAAESKFPRAILEDARAALSRPQADPFERVSLSSLRGIARGATRGLSSEQYVEQQRAAWASPLPDALAGIDGKLDAIAGKLDTLIKALADEAEGEQSFDLDGGVVPGERDPFSPL